MAAYNRDGLGRGKSIKQAAQTAKTNFEFAKELGAKDYAPQGSPSETIGRISPPTTANAGKYDRQ